MLSKAASGTIFWIFGMTRPGIEPRPPRSLVNTLLIRPNTWKRRTSFWIVRDHHTIHTNRGLFLDILEISLVCLAMVLLHLVQIKLTVNSLQNGVCKLLNRAWDLLFKSTHLFYLWIRSRIDITMKLVKAFTKLSLAQGQKYGALNEGQTHYSVVIGPTFTKFSFVWHKVKNIEYSVRIEIIRNDQLAKLINYLRSP